ncbi:hypothetical protein DOM22_05290 [Bdellovibrio sp. ZAP7]|uniref:hypothetical protein n=1 Tax=Bdellovibrio sp. ZAP7 TaxID=2231053 RepID=UPI001156C7CD|nr:hypothetical protein [Bdellovibrio sp. ZAP7]QDK44615.1 hypothetical protein DOM22_05290 [Bdellovibrio sp. ZAP7]
MNTFSQPAQYLSDFEVQKRHYFIDAFSVMPIGGTILSSTIKLPRKQYPVKDVSLDVIHDVHLHTDRNKIYLGRRKDNKNFVFANLHDLIRMDRGWPNPLRTRDGVNQFTVEEQRVLIELDSISDYSIQLMQQLLNAGFEEVRRFASEILDADAEVLVSDFFINRFEIYTELGPYNSDDLVVMRERIDDVIRRNYGLKTERKSEASKELTHTGWPARTDREVNRYEKATLKVYPKYDRIRIESANLSLRPSFSSVGDIRKELLSLYENVVQRIEALLDQVIISPPEKVSPEDLYLLLEGFSLRGVRKEKAFDELVRQLTQFGVYDPGAIKDANLRLGYSQLKKLSDASNGILEKKKRPPKSGGQQQNFYLLKRVQ